MIGFLLKRKVRYNYEMCQAAIEGWFPSNFWVQMNQTLARLGQLLKKEKDKKMLSPTLTNKCWITIHHGR
jgi:hypothetical protein